MAHERNGCRAAALLGLGGAARAAPGTPPRRRARKAVRGGGGGTPGVEARFLERREIALLSEPLETRGTIVFVPPDRLVRTTSEPSQTRLVIAGERFEF